MYREACFSQKMFTWVYHYEPVSKKKLSIEWKYSDSPVKKKIPGAAVSKEGHAWQSSGT